MYFLYRADLFAFYSWTLVYLLAIILTTANILSLGKGSTIHARFCGMHVPLSPLYYLHFVGFVITIIEMRYFCCAIFTSTVLFARIVAPKRIVLRVAFGCSNATSTVRCNRDKKTWCAHTFVKIIMSSRESKDLPPATAAIRCTCSTSDRSFRSMSAFAAFQVVSIGHTALTKRFISTGKATFSYKTSTLALWANTRPNLQSSQLIPVQ